MTILVFFALSFQSDTFYEHYQSGMDLLRKERHEEAITELEAAIALRAQSSERARTYSMRTIVYSPYRHLAAASLWTKRYEDARRYLSLAYRNNEHEFLDGSAASTMEAIATMVDAVLRPPAEPEPDSSAVDATRMFTVRMSELVNYIVLENYDRAEALLANLIRENPDDSNLLRIRNELGKLAETRAREREILESYDRQLADSLDAAEEAVARGDLRNALIQYQKVLVLDPENRLAQREEQRLWEAIEEQWRQEGRDTELELERFRASTRELRSQLESQIASLRADRARLESERRDIARELNDVLLSRPEGPTANWMFRAQESDNRFFANIRIDVRGNKPIDTVSLYQVNGDELIREFPFNGELHVSTPFVYQHEFPDRNGSVYALVRYLDGESARIEKEYLFPEREPPIYETDFFKGVLTFTACLLIAGFFFHKQWRRRKAFRGRFNPYIAGAPVLNDKMFYGRDMTLKQILNTLHNNSLMIYGERRIGKTSFLHRLNKELPLLEDPSYLFIPVLIDLQGVAEDEFFHTLDQEIALVLEGRGITLEPAPDKLEARAFISRLRKHIRALKEQCPKKPKLVLLLDEVDVMNGYSEHTNQQLRSVFMKGFADHIVAVMAGIHINTRWKSEGSPWYNFFEQIKLEPFGRKQADELITKPVRGIYTYDDEAVRRIIEITGGKPYLIQKMCLNLVAHILTQNKRVITSREVAYVHDNLAHELRGDRDG